MKAKRPKLESFGGCAGGVAVAEPVDTAKRRAELLEMLKLVEQLAELLPLAGQMSILAIERGKRVAVEVERRRSGGRSLPFAADARQPEALARGLPPELGPALELLLRELDQLYAEAGWQLVSEFTLPIQTCLRAGEEGAAWFAAAGARLGKAAAELIELLGHKPRGSGPRVMLDAVACYIDGVKHDLPPMALRLVRAIAEAPGRRLSARRAAEVFPGHRLWSAAAVAKSPAWRAVLKRPGANHGYYELL
jgi:hypothetical protein